MQATQKIKQLISFFFKCAKWTNFYQPEVPKILLSDPGSLISLWFLPTKEICYHQCTLCTLLKHTAMHMTEALWFYPCSAIYHNRQTHNLWLSSASVALLNRLIYQVVFAHRTLSTCPIVNWLVRVSLTALSHKHGNISPSK